MSWSSMALSCDRKESMILKHGNTEHISGVKASRLTGHSNKGGFRLPCDMAWPPEPQLASGKDIRQTWYMENLTVGRKLSALSDLLRL